MKTDPDEIKRWARRRAGDGGDGGGEGSRGGNVIGHTPSGKPIYGPHSDDYHSSPRALNKASMSRAHQIGDTHGYKPADHASAAAKHTSAARRLTVANFKEKTGHEAMAKAHRNIAGAQKIKDL